MKRRSKKRRSSCGYGFCFHGSFTNREKAERKARKRGGFVISRTPRGSSRRRYVVLTEQVPF